jgi:NDP-sugar pyrophosphorylase family protein
MKAMIFAAGLGTRLKPITDNLPKALVPIHDKTLLQRSIESLVAVGVDEIIVNVHHFAPEVIRYLANNNNFGAPIYISDESTLLLDTGGGIMKVKDKLLTEDCFLAVNVDVVTNINFTKLIEAHRLKNAIATLAVRNRKSSRYFLFDDENRLSGWQNVKNSQKITLCQRDETKPLAFSGIQVLSPEIFKYAPQKEVFGLVEWYLNAAESNRVFAYVHDSDYWFDAGSVEKINSIEKFLTFY